jgi:fructokinase
VILCVGEALIDMVPSGEAKDGLSAYVPRPGGAIFNTAIALGRLGLPTGLVSGISSDSFGNRLQQTLAESKVDVSKLSISDRLSTLAFVHLVGGHATYQFYDENSAGRMLKLEDMPAPDPNCSVLYCGGISLATEPCGAAYEQYICRFGKDKVVMIDPNVRPDFVKNESSFRERLQRIFAVSSIIKVSDEDLDWLVPEAKDLGSKVEKLHQMGAHIVVLTKGSRGASAFVKGGEEVTAPAHLAEVVDTVGAGDTFNAGFLARMFELGYSSPKDLVSAQADDVRDALDFGARVAAINVSRAGANPPWREEL